MKYLANIRFASCVAIACHLVSAPAAAAAQDNSATPSSQSAEATAGSDDIVVTATRKEELLSKVPISVSAFSQATLDQRSVKTVDDVVRLTPGLSLTRTAYGNGSGNTIAIRGIASGVGTSTTGIYVDDTPIQVRQLGFTATNAYPQIFDLDRVEVLRGPQGTLFGAGAQGGTVRFITPAPSLSGTKLYGRSEIAFTEDGSPSYEAGAAIGTPIVEDVLGIRVSGFYRRDGGWVNWSPYFPTGQSETDANHQEALVGRAALTFAPTENIKITPAIFFQRTKVNDTVAYWEATSNPEDGRFVNSNRNQQPSTDKMYIPSLNIEVGLGAVTLSSVTSFLHRDYNTTFDYTHFRAGVYTGNGIPPFPEFTSLSYFGNTQRNFNQEVKLQADLGQLKLLVGGFYSNSRQGATQTVYDPQFARLIQQVFGQTITRRFGTPLLPGDISGLTDINGRDTQYAAFGQADLTLFDRLTLTAGVRVSDLKYDYTSVQRGPVYGGLVSTAGSTRSKPVTPKFSVNYETGGGSIVYASASKGFRIGGAQAPIVSASCAADLGLLGRTRSPETFSPDSTWDYEVGAKGHALDNALQFDINVYRIKWSNIQTSFYLPRCGLSYVDNAGRATAEGIDLSVSVKPVSNFTVGLNLGYVNARYEDTLRVNTINLVTKGDKLPVSPFTASVTTRYDLPEGSLPLYVRADYNFRSAIKDASNKNPLNYSYNARTRLPGQENGVAVRIGGNFGNLDASFFVTNLLNEHALLNEFNNTRNDPVLMAITNRPRTIGLTLAFRQ